MEFPVVRPLDSAPITNRNFARLPFTAASQEYVSSGPLTPANAIITQADGGAVAPVALNKGTIFMRPANLLPILSLAGR